MSNDETHTHPEWLDAEAFHAAQDLFRVLPPADSEYTNDEPVTVTITKGQAHNLRGALRGQVNTFIGNVEMSQVLGYTPDETQAAETNDVFRYAVCVDSLLAEAIGEYPADPTTELNEDGFASEKTDELSLAG